MNIHIVDGRVRKLANEYEDLIVARDASAKNDQHKRVSKSFVALCMHALLDLDLPDAFEALTDGSGDLGIDGLHLGEVRESEFIVVLFQGKYAKKLDGSKAFPANEIAKLVRVVQLIFDPGLSYSANPLLEAQVEEIRSLVLEGNIPFVRIVTCNNGQQWDANGQQHIDTSDLPTDQISWEHLEHEAIIRLLSRQKKVETTLRFSGAAHVDEFDFRRALVGKVAVSEIARLLDTHGLRLLERNVRGFLGVGNRVNREIASTLRSPDRRGDFYFLNNGLTLVCDKFRHNAIQQRDYQVRVEGLQVVNGGQTAVTIQRVLADRPQDDLQNAHVLVRLYEIDFERDEGMLSRITLATNSQSPVELHDLRANDPIQTALQFGLADLGYTYMRKRREAVHRDRTIRSTEAAEAVLAVWRRQPHVARARKSQHFSVYYDRIFNDSLTPAQVILGVEALRMASFNVRAKDMQHGAQWLAYASHTLAMEVAALVMSDAGAQDATQANLSDLLHRMTSNLDLLVLAVRRVSVALMLLGLDPMKANPSLQRLASMFRRGDLVETLNTLEHQLRAELDPRRDLIAEGERHQRAGEGLPAEIARSLRDATPHPLGLQIALEAKRILGEA